jgi:cytochrome P450
MTARTLVRWAARHGAARGITHYAARRGNLQARIMCEPAAQADPFPLYDEMRATGPFAVMGGRLGLATARYDASAAVLRGDAFRAGMDFEGAPRLARAGMAWTHDDRLIGPIDPPSLLVVDPPEHTRYRRLVSKVFTARAIENMRPRVEALADGLLDGLAGAGPVDLMARYANLLPVTVIAEILAVPPDMVEQFLAWSAEASLTLDVGIGYRAFRRADDALREANEWLHGHFARLRRNPGDDLLSKLVGLVDDGERLTETELTAIAQLVLAAGYVTTVDLVGNGIVALLHHPDQLAALRADPAGWPNAVEEILRYDSPVAVSGRFAARDIEVSGVPISTGKFILILLGGANRDPAVFHDPHRFDIRRPNAREHLSFSRGIHHCLGAALARLEGEVALRRLFERFPDLSLAGDPIRRPTTVLRGYHQIPACPGPERS